ncbi:hypothetical protein ABW21_db0201894 [Orbilia brochopaga]|nr:hypothetical protein ABW21_db0201894 [Drechslerella brochopaga]
MGIPMHSSEPSSSNSGYRMTAARAICVSTTETFSVTIVADFHSEDGFTPFGRSFTATSATRLSDITSQFESSSTVQSALQPNEQLVYRTFQIRGQAADLDPTLTIAENSLLLRRRVRGGRVRDEGGMGIVIRACAGRFDQRGRFIRRGD